MNRFFFLTASLAFLMGSIAYAQDSTSRVQLFGGYSLIHADTGGLTGLTVDSALPAPSDTFDIRSNFTGWTAEAQYNASRWIGISGDFGGHSNAPITALKTGGVSGLPSESEYYFLVGPVLTYRSKTRLTPFAHALFGYERTRLNGSTITGLASPVISAATTFDDFTMALGAGVDYKIVRHVDLRVGQLDYFHTSLNLSKFYGNALGPTLFPNLSTRERNLRVSAGMVLHF